MSSNERDQVNRKQTPPPDVSFERRSQVVEQFPDKKDAYKILMDMTGEKPSLPFVFAN